MLRRILFMILAAASLASCASRGPVRAAVYADSGAMEPYIGAAQKTVADGGIECDLLMRADVTAEKLARYDVVVFPGGTGNGLAKSLGEEGCAAVTEFVREGGGAIGICAGGYLLAEGYNEGTRRIELVNARLWDLDNWERGEGTVDLEFTESGAVRQMRYENAPVFEPAGRDDMPHYVSIARFATDPAGEPKGRESIAGKDAIVAAPFGKGRAILFGPHPELTPGREHLLVEAVRWAAGRTSDLPAEE